MNVVKQAEDYLASIVHKWQSSGGDDSCSIILSLLEEIDRLNNVVEACGEENEALQAELDMNEDKNFIKQSVSVHRLPLGDI